MEKFVLFMCYRYDPDANSYVASAWKIMRLGGIATVILIAAGLTTLFLRGPRSLPAKSAVPAGNLQP
jgi:protein SCO1/2